MVDRKREQLERAAAVAALRAEQERREKRTRRLVVGVVGALLVGLIAWAAVVIGNSGRERAALDSAAEAPIEGVEVTEDLSNKHVPTVTPTPFVAGEALPPVGGDHDPVWQNCGIYSEPVTDANAIHSLEHGAVWIAYAPGLAEDQVGALKALTEGKPYTLLSPYPDLRSPVVLTAWGVQLELDDASDPRAAVFVEKYHQGEQTPEPGAACSGGVGTPE